MNGYIMESRPFFDSPQTSPHLAMMHKGILWLLDPTTAKFWFLELILISWIRSLIERLSVVLSYPTFLTILYQ